MGYLSFISLACLVYLGSPVDGILAPGHPPLLDAGPPGRSPNRGYPSPWAMTVNHFRPEPQPRPAPPKPPTYFTGFRPSQSAQPFQPQQPPLQMFRPFRPHSGFRPGRAMHFPLPGLIVPPSINPVPPPPPPPPAPVAKKPAVNPGVVKPAKNKGRMRIRPIPAIVLQYMGMNLQDVCTATSIKGTGAASDAIDTVVRHRFPNSRKVNQFLIASGLDPTKMRKEVGNSDWGCAFKYYAAQSPGDVGGAFSDIVDGGCNFQCTPTKGPHRNPMAAMLKMMGMGGNPGGGMNPMAALMAGQFGMGAQMPGSQMPGSQMPRMGSNMGMGGFLGKPMNNNHMMNPRFGSSPPAPIPQGTVPNIPGPPPRPALGGPSPGNMWNHIRPAHAPVPVPAMDPSTPNSAWGKQQFLVNNPRPQPPPGFPQQFQIQPQNPSPTNSNPSQPLGPNLGPPQPQNLASANNRLGQFPMAPQLQPNPPNFAQPHQPPQQAQSTQTSWVPKINPNIAQALNTVPLASRDKFVNDALEAFLQLVGITIPGPPNPAMGW